MASSASHTADIGLPGAGPRAVRTCEALAREIADEPAADRAELRGAHGARRHRADRRASRSETGRADRGVHLHRLLADPAVRRGLDARPDAARDGGGGRFAVGEGLPVMYVTEDTTRAAPETLKRAVRRGHRVRRAAHLPGGHRGPRDARTACASSSASSARRSSSRAARREARLARPPRPRAGDRQRARRHRGGRRPRARHRARHRRARAATPRWTCCSSTSSCWACTTATSPGCPTTSSAVSRRPACRSRLQLAGFGEDAFRTGTGVHAAAIIKARRRATPGSPTASTPACRRGCSACASASRSAR
jgi:hypothetical protein